MAESNYRLIGSIKNGESSDTLGYAVLDLRSNKAVFRSINELIALVGNGLTFQNAVFDSDASVLRGTDGSLNRLPVFSTDGKVLSNPTVTVLAEFKRGDTPTGYYKVMDTYGRTSVCTKEILIGYLQKLDGTNVKLVNRDGVFVISAILGSFNVIQSKEGNNSATSSRPDDKFMKSVSGAEMTEEINNNINKNKKTLADVNIKTKQFRSGIVRKLILHGTPYFDVATFQRQVRYVFPKVSEVSDIKGVMASKYNWIINLNSYLSVSHCYKFWDKLYVARDNELDRWYSAWERRLVREKKAFNRTLKRYNEMKSLDYASLAHRKSEGEWLSPVEFTFYLAGGNGGGLLRALNSRLLRLKDKVETSQVSMLVGCSPTVVAKKGNPVLYREKMSREDLLAYEIPFLKEYLLLGKLDYTLDTLSLEKDLLSKFSSKKELLRNLDLLFVVAVKMDLKGGKLAYLHGESRERINSQLDEYLKAGKYALRDSLDLVKGYLD